MKVIVTGGCGFIGSHLVEKLLTLGYEVLVIDDMSGGSMSNVKTFQKNPNFNLYTVDICNSKALEDIFTNVEIVFHLAGLADIVPSIEMPEKYFEANVLGTLNVLQASVKKGVKKFIYAASSSCYGIPSNYPTSENEKASPQYPYALTKYLGEQLVMHWGVVYGLETVALRLFNVYGPRARTAGAYGAVFGVFLAQKYHGAPLTVVGDGSQSRDFTYVSDVVDAFIIVSRSKLSGEIMNVGSGGHYTINELVALLGGEIIYLPKRPGEPDITFACIKKIKLLIGWEPKVSFQEGVAIMTEHVNDWADAPVWDEISIKKATASWFRQLSTK
jgi:UDP-glucose 4-epimerase